MAVFLNVMYSICLYILSYTLAEDLGRCARRAMLDEQFEAVRIEKS